MRYLLLFVLLLAAALPAFTQLSLVSSSPADGATSVPLHSTLSLTFNSALDTTQLFENDHGLLTNVVDVLARWYSADRRTVYFEAVLQPDVVYFVAVYYAPGAGGGKRLTSHRSSPSPLPPRTPLQDIPSAETA